MMKKRQDDGQSSKEVVIWASKERVKGDLGKTGLLKPTKQNGRRLTLSVWTQIREVPSGQQDGGGTCTLS